MSRSLAVLLCAGLLAALPAAATAKGPLPEPDDGPDPRGLTVTGLGAARVVPPARPTEATVERAVRAARPAALERAMADARARARALAAAAGLTLGEVAAVTVRDRELEQGYVAVPRWCSARLSRAGRCPVPPSAEMTVAVTFATQETSHAAGDGRALSAHGTASVPVRPENRHSSPSIAAALRRSRATALLPGLIAARAAATLAARASGLPPGPLFSIAEVRRPYEDFGQGSFGPGRYCGLVRRNIVRRDPAGRRRVVRRVRRRACFFSSRLSVGLRVTFLAPVSAP